MDNDPFKKGIADIRNAHLSDKEKSFILSNILHGRVKSPFWGLYAFMMQARQKALYALALAVVFLLAGGGTVVLAAEGSVPGDVLYSVKVNVTEPALDRLYTAREDKARWEGEKTARRLREVETLALEGRLDEEAIKAIEEKIQEHNETFRASASGISTTTEPEKRESVEVEYEAKLKAHAKILGRIKERLPEDTRDAIERVSETLREEVERNQEREAEREQEKKERAKDKTEEEVEKTHREVQEMLRDAEQLSEKTIETIREERKGLRDREETVRKDVLEESRLIIEETRNRLRETREARERSNNDGDANDAAAEKVISELADSERKIFETNAILKEMRKIKTDKRRDGKGRERKSGRDDHESEN